MSYNDLINKSRFFNKQPIYSKLGIKNVYLNIGCGPNMFPSSINRIWINSDREDFQEFLDRMKTADLNQCWGCIKQVGYYLQNNIPIDFRIHDLRKGFAQHADSSIAGIYSGQVVEHLNPLYEIPKLFKDCYRMLVPGGIIRLATPDLDIMIDAYNKGQMNKFACEQPELYQNITPGEQLTYLMFGSIGEKCTWDHYEGHFQIFNQVSMTNQLQKAGF